jgi:hypothetical protein
MNKSNYRPITILPLFSKIFEQILSRQLVDYFDHIMSPFMSAYRKHYSCETSLLRLVDDWKHELDNKNIVGIVLMDLSKAFDCLPHDLLLAKLSAYGIDQDSTNLMKDYLSNRLQRVKVKDSLSNWLPIVKGVPQGSVLGPTLFNIFLNDLFIVINNCKLNSYADDNQIYCAGPNFQNIKIALETDLQIASDWFKANQMQINPNKFQSMILGKLDSANQNINIGNVEIIVEQSIDLLGISIDNRLKFDKQITNICKKVNSQLAVLRRLKRFIPTDAKLLLYNGFIRPYMQYCGTVWHHCSKRNSNKLEKLNERVLRVVYSDYNHNYASILKQGHLQTLYTYRQHNICTLVFKALNGRAPSYISDMLLPRLSGTNLRGLNNLRVPKVKTTINGLDSFSYMAPHLWNQLDDGIKSADTLSIFKRKINNFVFKD